jgi:hypothetical protein
MFLAGGSHSVTSLLQLATLDWTKQKTNGLPVTPSWRVPCSGAGSFLSLFFLILDQVMAGIARERDPKRTNMLQMGGRYHEKDRIAPQANRP